MRFAIALPHFVPSILIASYGLTETRAAHYAIHEAPDLSTEMTDR
jgi:hypothetical protein